MSDLNPNTSPHFDDVLQAAMAQPSRRHILRGGLGLSALSFLGLAGCGGSSTAASNASPVKALNFSATPLNQSYDGVSVASGYKAELLYKLGDPINAATPAYLNNGSESAASFDFRAGDHHDGMYFFGMGSAACCASTMRPSRPCSCMPTARRRPPATAPWPKRCKRNSACTA